jgi:hypothetical protein
MTSLPNCITNLPDGSEVISRGHTEKDRQTDRQHGERNPAAGKRMKMHERYNNLIIN